jgi:hypothetical protein
MSAPIAKAAFTGFPREMPATPTGTIRAGSDAHRALMCRTMLTTHDPYKPALIDWPVLDAVTQNRITSLPIWDIAVATEGRASLNVSTFAATVADPLMRSAIAMNAFEEGRHKLVLGDMVRAYGIDLVAEPAYVTPRDPEWAFMVTGFSECIDSFFGFGLFKIAKDSGFFPADLVDTFEPVMREEGRHILFFVNWVAWHRANLRWWQRPAFALKVAAVWAFLIWERFDMAKGMGGDNTKAQENNFTLNGSKELGVEIEFPELAAICLAENDRRLGVYDARLIRPRFVPAMMRLALRVMGKGKLLAA